MHIYIYIYVLYIHELVYLCILYIISHIYIYIYVFTYTHICMHYIYLHIYICNLHTRVFACRLFACVYFHCMFIYCMHMCFLNFIMRVYIWVHSFGRLKTPMHLYIYIYVCIYIISFVSSWSTCFNQQVWLDHSPKQRKQERRLFINDHQIKTYYMLSSIRCSSDMPYGDLIII